MRSNGFYLQPQMTMNILAIETSCDETSVAVLSDTTVLSNVISSQMEHSRYGGVIPELASRAHVVALPIVFREALQQARLTMADIHGISVTTHPGLMGALLVGANFAKGLALRYSLPIVAVNHIEGHIFSGFVENPTLELPFVALVVSGGHTSIFWVQDMDTVEVIGSTRDDAAGEAFDKVAKMLGLGYPGGAKIDALAQQGNPAAIQFPRAMKYEDHEDFSFSGLKTAVRTYLQKTLQNTIPENLLPDICASVQEAIADVLVHKTLRAATRLHARSIVVAGGVAANSRLRSLLAERAAEYAISVYTPSLQLCTDNAAMIAYVGYYKLKNGISHGLGFSVGTTALRAPRRSQ